MSGEDKTWIFVSHSTRDIEKVRRVRNALEASGAEPMLFFLKCVSDSDELDSLLKREIDARTFFLLCDSPNARGSKWVQQEVAYVRSLNGRCVQVVDLDADWKRQLDAIQALSRVSHVYLSCPGMELSLRHAICDLLLMADFTVQTQETANDFAGKLADILRYQVTDAMNRGYFVQLVSRSTMKSQWPRLERDIARSVEPRRCVLVALDSLDSDERAAAGIAPEEVLIDGTSRDPDAIFLALRTRLFQGTG